METYVHMNACMHFMATTERRRDQREDMDPDIIWDNTEREENAAPPAAATAR